MYAGYDDCSLAVDTSILYRVRQSKISKSKNRNVCIMQIMQEYFTQYFPHLFIAYVFTSQFNFTQLPVA